MDVGFFREGADFKKNQFGRFDDFFYFAVQLLGAKKELQAHELASLETETSKSREEAETIWACQMTERIWNTKRQLLMEKLELDNEVLNGVSTANRPNPPFYDDVVTNL